MFSLGFRPIRVPICWSNARIRASTSSSVIWPAVFTAISWAWGASRQPPRVFIQKIASPPATVYGCGARALQAGYRHAALRVAGQLYTILDETHAVARPWRVKDVLNRY